MIFKLHSFFARETIKGNLVTIPLNKFSLFEKDLFLNEEFIKFLWFHTSKEQKKEILQKAKSNGYIFSTKRIIFLIKTLYMIDKKNFSIFKSIFHCENGNSQSGLDLLQTIYSLSSSDTFMSKKLIKESLKYITFIPWIEFFWNIGDKNEFFNQLRKNSYILDAINCKKIKSWYEYNFLNNSLNKNHLTKGIVKV